MNKGKQVHERSLAPEESDLITLDATLLLAMETAKDRAFILDIESLIVNFIQNTQLERTELEPINSYYRLLVHRIARFYGIEHTIEPNRPAILVLSKTLETKIPLIRLYELIDRPPPHQFVRPDAVIQQSVPSFKIMRRASNAANGPPTMEAVPAGAEHKPSQERESEASRAPSFAGPLPPHAEPKTLHHGVSETVSKNAGAAKVDWKLDAAEFDPFSSRPSTFSPPPPPRPIFTKPIISPEAVHLPQHIVLIRLDQGTVQSLQPYLEQLTRLLGPSWEVRTKPTHKDALLICSSALQAEAVLNEPKFRMPGGLYVAKHREIRISEIARQLIKGSDDFDLIGLQELWMSSDYTYLRQHLQSKYPYSSYFYSGAVGSGLATFSKYPIEAVQFRRYSVGGRPEDIFKGDWFAAKGIAISRVLLPDGQTLALMNTHMAASYNRTVDGYDCYETHRLIQAYEFGRTMQEQSRLHDAVIGMGDFNLQPSSLAYRAFLMDKSGLISDFDTENHVRSAFEEVHGEEPPSFNGFGNTFRKDWEATQAIDHILHIGLMPIEAKMALTERLSHYDISLSDHYGLAAEFVLESSSSKAIQLSTAEQSALSEAVISKIRERIVVLNWERKVSFEYSVALMFTAICLLTGMLMIVFREGSLRVRDKVHVTALILAAVLSFVLGFAELFKGFAFIGEELAAHRQFLSEFLYCMR